jgi:hypothetical protein
MGSSAGHMVARKKRDEVVDMSRCRVAVHDRSLHAGFAVVYHKIVGLLGEARRAETGSGRAEKLRCRGTRDGITGLVLGGRRLR